MPKLNYMLNGTERKSLLVTRSCSLLCSFSSNNIKSYPSKHFWVTILKSKENTAKWFKSVGFKARLSRRLEQICLQTL